MVMMTIVLWWWWWRQRTPEPWISKCSCLSWGMFSHIIVSETVWLFKSFNETGVAIWSIHLRLCHGQKLPYRRPFRPSQLQRGTESKPGERSVLFGYDCRWSHCRFSASCLQWVMSIDPPFHKPTVSARSCLETRPSLQPRTDDDYDDDGSVDQIAKPLNSTT